MSESVILCEGYYGRAFWAGWLTRLGCKEPVRPVSDPMGRPVSLGHYAFYSQSSRFIRIVPCRGKNNILQEARRRLAARETERVVHLVINSDSDAEAEVDAKTSTAIGTQAVGDLVHRLDPRAKRIDDGAYLLDAGVTSVFSVQWRADDRPMAGVPSKQTLERLICASLVAAYPDRAPAVQAWLDSRPAPPKPDPKEHAWSYMAGWYAGHGCEYFCRYVWQDPGVARELEARLRAGGAWRVAERIAG
jgi:hypothetical protein